MAQPNEAAGEAVTTPVDANPASAFEDIAADLLGEDEQDEEQPVTDEGEAEAEPEAEADEPSEEDIEPDEGPAIEAPNSGRTKSTSRLPASSRTPALARPLTS